MLVLSGLFSIGMVSGLLAATADDYAKAGLKLYTSGDYAHAIPYFDAALKLDPNNASALQGRAFSYFAQGQYQKAAEDGQRVLALNPANAQIAKFTEQAKAKAMASGRRGTAKAPASTTAPSTAAPSAVKVPAQAAPAVGAQAAPSDLNSEDEEFKEGRIFLMKDFLKAYWKGNQKWPETVDELVTYLQSQPAYKEQAWEAWGFNMTLTEMPNGSISAKCSIKRTKENKPPVDAQFTMDVPK
jgi:tetratricopeptide (TPR) repeat protein